MDARVIDVDQDTRPCPFCDQPVTGPKVLALFAAGVRWAHQLCAIQASGRRVSAMLPRSTFNVAGSEERACA